MSWNIREFPILTWRWRAHTLPVGADERYKRGANAAAAAVYVIFSYQWITGIPTFIKYNWSTSQPIGTATRGSLSRYKFEVVESGIAQLGQWSEVRVDVYEDYVRRFGGKPPNKIVAIAILTDGDASEWESLMGRASMSAVTWGER